MGMIPIFDDPHAISLTPNPELVSEMARSGYQNTPDLYQIMTMHMHEQAPSTKGPEPHNRPGTSAALHQRKQEPGAPVSEAARTIPAGRMRRRITRKRDTPNGFRILQKPLRRINTRKLR